ncbi:MAG: sigma-70 family RNA polymerase sigma factor [Oxalobacteraceae bacterium]|nr:MAG: sigma-70 family RNA polymerase sigma factor [Oxalobacteraceae bacterium]
MRLVSGDSGSEAAASIDPSLMELFSTNQAMILRYLRAQGADEHAEDLLQELWIKVQRAPQVEHVSRAYLMKMAHNLVLDEARSATRRKQRDRVWHVDGPMAIDVDPAPDAEQSLISRESLKRMEDVLRQLGPRTEAIIRRHRIDGVPQRQLALEEGLSLSAVEKHLQKAYRAIAQAQIEFDVREGHL